jgi:hypothetical protein
MDSFISFVKINKKNICDLYNENDWSHTQKINNDQFHNAMRNIILDMNRQEKQIVNVLIAQFASEIGLFFTTAPIDAAAGAELFKKTLINANDLLISS